MSGYHLEYLRRKSVEGGKGFQYASQSKRDPADYGILGNYRLNNYFIQNDR